MKKWVVSNKIKNQKLKIKSEDIIELLLKNRGLSTDKARKDFLHPIHPEKLTLKELEIDEKEINKTVNRIKEAKTSQEKVIVYGDYDADGICATAVLWEALFASGLDVLPYIPERFSEGYGINVASVKSLLLKEPGIKLILTVDNGIVANKEISEIHNLGIDVVVIDHHTLGQVTPKAYSVIHTTQISAAAIAWVLARELKADTKSGLDLVAIATIADQVPLLGANRSFAKFGLEILRTTQRKGLLALFDEAAIKKEDITTYAVGFLIAPRINAMGRLEHAIDSLRLLCTKNSQRAKDLAKLIGKTNLHRQKIVDEVVVHARETFLQTPNAKFIILAAESYHEGVIGLAASRLVDEFYKPAIVISKGKELSKASARSIPGFNMIESIRKLADILLAGGGHPMAAGFSLATKDIAVFSKRFTEINKDQLTAELLERKLKIDVELEFKGLTTHLAAALLFFEPTGLGNPTPTFITTGVEIVAVKPVGREGKHLKLVLKQGSSVFDAIAFNMGEKLPGLKIGKKLDVVYTLEENVWNGRTSLQLKVRDFILV